jgi:hypothetical protein
VNDETAAASRGSEEAAHARQHLLRCRIVELAPRVEERPDHVDEDKRDVPPPVGDRLLRTRPLWHRYTTPARPTRRVRAIPSAVRATMTAR